MQPTHYPSLELCKKLTEIGFPTTFQHIGDSGGTVIGCGEIPEGMYVSPTVMEMLDVIPETILKKQLGRTFGEKSYEQVHWFSMGKNWTMYRSELNDRIYKSNDTLPNALAEMILWLHENNYISFTK